MSRATLWSFCDISIYTMLDLTGATLPAMPSCGRVLYSNLYNGTSFVCPFKEGPGKLSFYVTFMQREVNSLTHLSVNVPCKSLSLIRRSNSRYGRAPLIGGTIERELFAPRSL